MRKENKNDYKKEIANVIDEEKRRKKTRIRLSVICEKKGTMKEREGKVLYVTMESKKKERVSIIYEEEETKKKSQELYVKKK